MNHHPGYLVRGRRYGPADGEALMRALQVVHGTGERPLCLCKPDGVPMYVAKLGDGFLIKRMPDSGAQHAPSCDSFDLADTMSGMGELVAGQAIVEVAPDTFRLNVGFSLARGISKAPVQAVPHDVPPQVKRKPPALSLRGLLQLLLHRAGFNRWTPAMAGKRTYGVVAYHLAKAAEGLRLKRRPMQEAMFLPQRVRPERAQYVQRLRADQMRTLTAPLQGGGAGLALVVGEFLGFEDAPAGRRVWLAEMPEMPLYVDRKTCDAAMKGYGALMRACEGNPDLGMHLLLIGLAGAQTGGGYQFESLCLQLTSASYVPVEFAQEARLIDQLQAQERRFIKPLRMELKSAAALPTARLQDAQEELLPLFAINPFGSEEFVAAQHEAIAGQPGAWVWPASEVSCPALPPLSTQPAAAPLPV